MLAAALAGVDGWDVPHVAVGVVGPEGVLDRHGDPDWQVRVASVTKPVFATAVLVAVEEGTLDLDQPAGPPGSTVRHLLAHASGLPFLGDEPIAAVGTRRIYSNAGFDILGEVLAEASGMTAAEYLHEAVLAPLGMARSELRGSPAKDLWSTVGDLCRYAVELLRPTLLAPDTAAAQCRSTFPDLAGVLPEVGTFRPNPWGLGIEVRGAKAPHWSGTRCSPTTVGHFGGSGTFLWVDPVAEVGMVCLTDREFGPWSLEVWPPLSDAVLRALGH